MNFPCGKIIFPTEQSFVPRGKEHKNKNSVRNKTLFRGKRRQSPTTDFSEKTEKIFVPRKRLIAIFSARNKSLFRSEQNFVPREKSINLFSGRKINLDLRPFGTISVLSCASHVIVMDGMDFARVTRAFHPTRFGHGWVSGVTHLRFSMGVGTWVGTHLSFANCGYRVWVSGATRYPAPTRYPSSSPPKSGYWGSAVGQLSRKHQEMADQQC